MGWIARFYRSTIGRKIVMAVTGLILVGFVTGHMSGNLLYFRGPPAINAYSRFLKGTGGLLWVVRAVLLISLLLHVHSAWTLTRRAREARPVDYEIRKRLSSTLSARTMRWGGVLLLAFVIFHLLNLTGGLGIQDFDPGDVYSNLLMAFSVPVVGLFYVVAMAALALHLHHGVSSLFQTLGANHPHLNTAWRRLAIVLAVVVPLGFAAIPAAILLRLFR